MVSDDVKDRIEQARRDGFTVFGVDEGPIRLDHLIELVKDIFPNHALNQLAITQADEDRFVVAAELGIQTKSN